ncbi:hypothetical protein RB598_002192 [Gaeumannomyces tritici]
MVPKLFWAALFFTPAVLGAALPEVQENALDLGRRDEVEIASLPLVARAEANVVVAGEAAAPEEVDDETDVADADKKKKKKKHGHKKGKKKHGHKKGKKHGHKKPPHDLEARDEAEVQAPGAEVVADDVDSDADVADADKKKKKKHGHKKGKKKHGHKKGKKHGHKKHPHDLEAREEAALAENVVADQPDNEADVADADKKKKKKHGHKKGKKKHGHKKGKGKKHGHKKGPPHE